MEDENIYPSIFATPLDGVQYTVNISQVFGDAFTFDEVIHILSIATPYDHITFNINSDGGNLYSLIALRNAIRATQGNVHMHLLGMAASAGGALFLEAAHTYQVHDNSCLMIHNMLCGTGYDDTHKILTRADHNKKVNERFIKETYESFLTEDEINAVISGREIYLEDWEIRERLINRQKIRLEKVYLGSEDEEVDLSDFTDEDLNEELNALNVDIKKIKAELKRRESLQKQNNT